MSFRVTPEEAQFDAGLLSPVKIEGRVLGVYFGDEEICGETGASIKSRHSRITEMMRKDSEEALGVANALPQKLFQEAVKNGLLDAGPYARESIASTNALLKAKLIGADGKLIGEYKQWLKMWHDSLKPATSARPKRSSQRPGQ
ncbi:MAG: hypothetical protein FJW36_24380 [Acidobacteria bacterium]|nr:hypothetical protein [Acidobacteriota bacterium]